MLWRSVLPLTHTLIGCHSSCTCFNPGDELKPRPSLSLSLCQSVSVCVCVCRWHEAVMFWDRKNSMGNSQRRPKGRHRPKSATGTLSLYLSGAFLWFQSASHSVSLLHQSMHALICPPQSNLTWLDSFHSCIHASFSSTHPPRFPSLCAFTHLPICCCHVILFIFLLIYAPIHPKLII